MQPYIFPYLGYFQLIHASSHLVFYDDVNFIKQGWINRNRILLNGEAHLITLPLKAASPNRRIMDIEVLTDKAFRKKLYRKLEHAYARAPYFVEVMDMVTAVISGDKTRISEMAIQSVVAVQEHLGLPFTYSRSSKVSPGTVGLGRADRLIQITRDMGYHKYVNSPGGRALYDKAYFIRKGVEIKFIEADSQKYDQHQEQFVDALSIIDVLMYNSREQTKTYLHKYKLV